ncbi:hypothetical protein C8F04DRAFT_1255471 [Mycena alexandri]|uniref:Uncharacterized protein n=1 Tax=Mycena alexandri TaxID=1745969 RepID=A0AAD6X6Y3_9AGAR|nr:hypothetical protein C8F04DRAFT_1255471 [Mycena alexandri]
MLQPLCDSALTTTASLPAIPEAHTAAAPVESNPPTDLVIGDLDTYEDPSAAVSPYLPLRYQCDLCRGRRDTALKHTHSERQHADSTGRAHPITRDQAPILQPEPEPVPVRAQCGHCIRPTHYTVDGNPPCGAYATPPEGGYHRVYGVTTASLYHNHDKAQKRTWDEVPEPKLVISISSGNLIRTQTQPKLITFFDNYFNLDKAHRARLRVGAPALGQQPGPDPKVWLVTGLSTEHTQWLLHVSMVLRNDGLTLFTHRFSPEISGYITTFEGLIISANDTDLARAIIGGAISDEPRIASHVRTHRDRSPPDWSADEAFTRFCKSITITSIDLLAPNRLDKIYWGHSGAIFRNDRSGISICRGAYTAWNV